MSSPPGQGKITALVTASQITAGGRPLTPATDMTVGARVEWKFLVDGKPSIDSTKIIRRDGPVSGYWRFSGGGGAQQVAIYYNGSATPAQTATFTIATK